MKIPHDIKDTDKIEIPIYVNGSFAERIYLTGKELTGLVTLLREPVKLPDGSITIEVDGTDQKPLDINVSTDTANYNPDDPNINFTKNAGDVPPTPTAGDDAKELRKDSEPQAGDDTAEKRID